MSGERVVAVLSALIYSGGGIVVGILGVTSYAKATGQAIRWGTPNPWRRRA